MTQSKPNQASYTDEDLRELVDFALSCHEALVRYGEHVPSVPPQVEKARKHLAKVAEERRQRCETM